MSPEKHGKWTEREATLISGFNTGIHDEVEVEPQERMTFR